MSRRTLLRGAGVVTAAVAVTGTGAVSYRAFDNGVLNAGTGEAYDAWAHWRDDPTPQGAVAAAILAASPHNTQPWLFAVGARHVNLFADPARRMAVLDPLGREAAIGLGCALENLTLGLEARGFRPTVTLLPDPRNPDHIAQMRLEEATPTRSPLYDAIGDRHSNRGPYAERAVPATLLASLSALADDSQGTSIRWLVEEHERRTFADLIIEATEAIITDEPQSVDSFSWFRATRDDIVRHKDGLTLDVQGMNPITLAVAKLLPASSRSTGDRFWLDQTKTVHTATARAYGVITVADPSDPKARLEGGRLLQRIHLAATDHGLAMQHMNQVTERIDREESAGLPTTFAPRMEALLADGDRKPLTSFRLGYAKRKAGVGPRRPASEVTL